MRGGGMAEPERALNSPRLPKHGEFYIGLAAGVVAFFASLWIVPPYAFAIGVNVLFAVYLALIGLKFRRLTPEVLRHHADESDLPAWVLLGMVVIAVGVSIFELFRALNGGGSPALEAVAVGLVSVILGWFTIHTMAALHYAFEYYGSAEASPGGKRSHVGGLKFPDGDTPDGIAFLYFSYAIGTSTAVSDVTVTSNNMRKLVMLHSVFSFFFNTLIVAAMVNVTVAVGAG
ncbi:MAG: DUF1345 domain-containing protein [Alphaproteobacteria bacterium]|nr:MAG: DUF1345 domain-containing protein [Alphaproteobacteria bacterium]